MSMYSTFNTADLIYLCGGDAVNKADLLESFLAHGQADLPPIVHSFVHHLQGNPRLV